MERAKKEKNSDTKYINIRNKKVQRNLYSQYLFQFK